MESLDQVRFSSPCPLAQVAVFLNNAEPFTLKLEQLQQPLSAEWYHPHSGERRPAGTLEEGTASLEPPAEWGDDPVVLHAVAE